LVLGRNDGPLVGRDVGGLGCQRAQFVEAVFFVGMPTDYPGGEAQLRAVRCGDP
jgi:hypothetical protein